MYITNRVYRRHTTLQEEERATHSVCKQSSMKHNEGLHFFSKLILCRQLNSKKGRGDECWSCACVYVWRPSSRRRGEKTTRLDVHWQRGGGGGVVVLWHNKFFGFAFLAIKSYTSD